MKKIPLIIVILICALRLPAQTNESARLALVSESPDASVAADVLTAELSSHKNLQLLERNEIEKVYREQGLSAGNRDYLKLGQILGADGLLLLEIAREGTNQFLNVRLIAVKPGVVLVAEKFLWPVANLTEWSPAFARHLDLFTPKLSVLGKDAIPISVVNLRSAVQSDEAKEAERELKLLTIQRLSQERQFFVLERQKLQLLSEEKDLKLDDSAFWNGSYLLEGVVDQNGYSKESITINARLTPPKGGVSLQFEVSGSRTNLAEVINQLAVKVNEELKINSAVKEWNAADEAAQYFDEAQWALRWGVYSEAQTAVESAWALGKRDLDCASLRIRTYVSEVPMVAAPNVAYFQNGKKANYVHINEPPDPKYCDVTLYALKCYYEFSRTSPDGEPKILTRGKGWNDWHNSDWYQLGIDALVAASSVLEHYNYLPESQKPVAEKLAELRALARSAADLISKSPTVYDSYFVGDRFVTHDELGNTIEEHQNIFRCKLEWGRFWQETPEDDIALYRELMSTPTFCYIHSTFWSMEPPRLVAWNEADRQRLPVVWGNFVKELDNSTNVLLQLEAKAIKFADAGDEKEMVNTFNSFFDALFTNRDTLVNNNVEVLNLNWGADALVQGRMSKGIVSDVNEVLQQRFYSEYRPKLEAMDQEYWNKTVPAQKTIAAFDMQKQYLKENKPYDFMGFVNTFQEKNYSKAQALEIQPLIAYYKSNLVVQCQGASVMQKGQLMGAIAQVGFLENEVSRILNPPAPKPQQPAQAQIPQPAPIAKPVVMAPVLTNAPEIITNVLTVDKFLPIPLDGLPGDQISDVTITAHHWLEGRLLLDFSYGAFIYSFDENGNWKQTRGASLSAIAILDPATGHWDVMGCPEVGIGMGNNFYHRSTLLHGELFTSDGGQIRKYDFSTRRWRDLDISGEDNFELFTVNDCLYAANRNLIFEIVDGGKSTQILASTRRHPAVSVLDTEDLGTPTLFEGPGHSLRVCTKSKIFTWTGNDWHEDSPAPPASFPPVISADGLLFRTDGFNLPASVSSLAVATNTVEFLLGHKKSPANNPGFYRPDASPLPEPQPRWQLPPDLFLANLPAACHQADLYLLVDHSEAQVIIDNQQHLNLGKKIIAKGGCNTEMLSFSRDLPAPQKLFLKFDSPEGCPPATGVNPGSSQMFQAFPAMPSAWMLFTSNLLFFGLENHDNMSRSAGLTGVGYKAGVWIMPVAQLEAAIAAQKQIQREQAAQAVAAAEQSQKNILTKYDLNHNGVIDPDERESALDEPDFIGLELSMIDANHNGRLEAKELAYFDANKNKILEPKEQAGIEIAQHLLAEKLLKKFDANSDGLIESSEYDDLVQSSFEPNARPMAMTGTAFLFPDQNHDRYVDLGELETFLNQQMRRGLRSHEVLGMAFMNNIRTGANQPIDSRQIFKASVEAYWQNPGGVTNKPPFNRPSSVGGVATNRMQNSNP